MLNKVLVVGAGTMGQGIAQWMAQQGIEVELADIRLEAISKGVESINKSWKRLVEKGKFTADEVLSWSANLKGVDLETFSPNPDLFIEAIAEDLDIKKGMFKDADQMMNEKTIFASNTSSLSINKLCEDLSTARKRRFVGLHFFNPVPIMKLVEIIQGNNTDQEIIDNLKSWFEERGKVPALCQDSPGFIVNRMARNFYGEPLRIVQDFNRKKITSTDTILREVGGFKMGPFELLDLIGIDVNLSVTRSVWEAFKKAPRFAPHKLQEGMVNLGLLGKKTGEGYYNYEK
ncbi:MAG: 3-hydroxybutyryl-CoA dehydrogenase [Epsilonproteobacteria bacterium]|nr:MAG: 3-hydroxybutyryl-CoA dehydrogenase [Campylobacterota bacterium]RLA68140.1 MAG: 3-hydroxybutyryl-CoA dehydrogenase [Campylobacterota bacterium]